jgi:uncharacterized protein
VDEITKASSQPGVMEQTACPGRADIATVAMSERSDNTLTIYTDDGRNRLLGVGHQPRNRTMTRLLILLPTLFLLVGCQTRTTRTGHGATPMGVPGTLSSNWMAAAKMALPAKYSGKDLSFQEVTNLLCQESRNGNIPAQALWGLVLMVQQPLSEEAKAGLELVRNSASRGYVPAMLQLGLVFEDDKYVRRDYDEAFHWFSLAADKGNSEAQLQMGGCYHYGLGTTQDLSKAAECYRRSAGQTNYVAMKSLGYLLLNGLGVGKDLVSARHWLTRAAEEGGNRRAMSNLGSLCLISFPNTNAMAEAFQWYTRGAELGDALACLQLANFYYHGWGVVTTNLETYRDWRLKAAKLGVTDAQYTLGSAYRTGDGVPQDVANSLLWYRKAAAKNHPRALYDLALHYLEDKTNRASMLMAQDYMLRAAKAGHREAQFQCALSDFRGDGLPPEFESGKQWLRRAAENGWARAEFCLFQLCYNGIPPAPQCPAYPKDPAEGIRWLRRAAEHENWQAQSVLAVMLIRGTSMEQDKPAAEKLLRNAAAHGYGQAQNDLGFAILSGQTSTSDLVEAAMWCQLAASGLTSSNILQRAKVNLATALSRLTADQQIEVEQRVKAFQPLAAADLDPMCRDWENNPLYVQEDGRFGH